MSFSFSTNCRKGIILAAGNGSRLYPLTILTNKQLLPLYNKPVIYYPLTTLMLAGITDILIISSEIDLPRLKALLGDGRDWNLNIAYDVQKNPRGIADAFIIAEDFINNDPSCLILGDNVFYGHGLPDMLTSANDDSDGCNLFAYKVHDPKRYGVANFTKDGKILDIEEKPENPKSNYAVTGLYFYDNNVCDIAKNLKPSARGELEITDVNKAYVKEGLAKINTLGRGFAWFDVGTPKSLAKASQYIQIIEEQQGTKIGCPEEIAWRQKWLDLKQLHSLIEKMPTSDYKTYLNNLIAEEIGSTVEANYKYKIAGK